MRSRRRVVGKQGRDLRLAGVDPMCVQRRCGDRDALACAAGGATRQRAAFCWAARWETPVMGATP